MNKKLMGICCIALFTHSAYSMNDQKTLPPSSHSMEELFAASGKLTQQMQNEKKTESTLEAVQKLKEKWITACAQEESSHATDTLHAMIVNQNESEVRDEFIYFLAGTQGITKMPDLTKAEDSKTLLVVSEKLNELVRNAKAGSDTYNNALIVSNIVQNIQSTYTRQHLIPEARELIVKLKKKPACPIL